jgi:GAF domain-containing protein
LQSLSNQARAFRWDDDIGGILQIPEIPGDPTSNTDNLIENYGRISLAEIRAFEERERMETVAAWKTKTHRIIEDEGISPERFYNADQTGLFYTKLPNKVHIDKETRQNTKGTKQMK